MRYGFVQLLSLTVVPYFEHFEQTCPIYWFRTAHSKKHQFGSDQIGFTLAMDRLRKSSKPIDPSLTRSSKNLKLQDFLKDESEIGQKLGP